MSEYFVTVFQRKKEKCHRIFKVMQKLKNLQMRNMVKAIIQLNHHAIKKI